VGRIVFLVGFALLGWFAAPGLYLRDSGELTTAAFTLGVAHETGFPLFCMLGKLASLVPIGEVAFRLNLLSALFGALSAWLVYRVVDELAGKDAVAKAGGAGGAAILLAGLTFWKASTVAEVYASTAAAIALSLWLLALAARGRSQAGLALALVGGLSLGLHAQLRILIGPAVAVFALLRLRKGARWPLYAPLFVAVGGAVIAYLPLRASRAPAANWLDPRTLGGVLRHLSAHQIRASFAGQIFTRDLGILGENVRDFVGQVEGQLGILILLVALGGVVWLLLRARAVGVVLALLLVGDLLYSSWINPMGIDDLQCGAPTAVALAICAGAGLAAAARRLPKMGQPFLAGTLGVISLVPAVWSDHEAKFSLGFEATTWSRAALEETPPRMTIYATTDDLLAGLFYEQVVAGARPDVKVIARQQARGKLEPPAMWEAGGDLPPIGVLEPGLPLEKWTMTPQPLPPAVPIGEHAALLLEPAREPFARRLFAGGLTGLGRAYALRGEDEQGRLMFETALKVRPNDAVALTNLAVLRAKAGDFAGALKLCDEVLARDPSRLVTRLNAARYRAALSDVAGAEREFREVLRRSPGDPGALSGLQKLHGRR
jgi:hypothetical protein